MPGHRRAARPQAQFDGLGTAVARVNEYSGSFVVYQGVSGVSDKARAYHLCAVTLVLFTALVGTLRPLARISAHTHNPLGLSRLIFLSEPAVGTDPPLVVPVRAHPQVFAPLAFSALLLVLKTRRLALLPVPIRRLKLPTHAATDSLLSD